LRASELEHATLENTKTEPTASPVGIHLVTNASTATVPIFALSVLALHFSILRIRHAPNVRKIWAQTVWNVIQDCNAVNANQECSLRTANVTIAFLGVSNVQVKFVIFVKLTIQWLMEPANCAVNHLNTVSSVLQTSSVPNAANLI